MCAKATPAAAGFAISGLLDAKSRMQERYPIAEIDVATIEDHPNNGVYSMDAAEIEKLAESIRRDGLTDIPLVRKLDTGQLQMLSGHRRKAAFALLAREDDAFAKMPCRIVNSVDDEHALVLLHTANLFTRELTATERAAASRALGVEVERLRESEPTLKGKRTEDIKADIISSQTGKKVSGRSIRRQEELADKIDQSLDEAWKQKANKGELSAAAIEALAAMPAEKQREIATELPANLGKQDTTLFIEEHASDAHPAPDKQIEKALAMIEKCLSRPVSGDYEQNCVLASVIVSKALDLQARCEHSKSGPGSC